MPQLLPLPALDDAEGAAVPAGLRVFDAHVHLFPARLFEAIWRWFDAYAWPVRYRLHADQVIEFLLGRGVARMTALLYAHKPGMARDLNRFVAELGRAHSQIVPLGTVMPGEPETREIVREALGRLGLRGIKLHCHVQRMAADDARLDPVYEACAVEGRPVVIHSGREPSSPAYGLDTHALCAASQIDRVLERHPRLRLVVPHLGVDEYDDYAALLDRHDRLWLDTTMAIAGYFEPAPPRSLFPGRAERLLYGTDFPNLPYAWDRELGRLLGAIPDDAMRRRVLWENAEMLFG
jgi:predicted TIM-barrel fold metal-dependent hydrolase